VCWRLGSHPARDCQAGITDGLHYRTSPLTPRFAIGGIASSATSSAQLITNLSSVILDLQAKAGINESSEVLVRLRAMV